MEFFGMQEDEIIESRMVSKTIERAQERVEKHNFDQRKNLLEYDDVLNQQRIVIYNHRRNALEGEKHIYELIRDFICAIVEDLVAFNAPQKNMSPDQVTKIYTAIELLTGLTEKDFKDSGITSTNVEIFTKDLINFLLERYDLFRRQQNENIIKSAEKWLVLETIDQSWKQQMLNLDHLKEGIWLRGWGQKTPLIEYKREAFDMFREMMTHIQFSIIQHIFHLNINQFDPSSLENRREKELEDMSLISGDEQGNIEVSTDVSENSSEKSAGNEECGCGSGKKYKRCHGILDEHN
jgi:preprotein translocase subunit SecA